MVMVVVGIFGGLWFWWCSSRNGGISDGVGGGGDFRWVVGKLVDESQINY